MRGEAVASMRALVLVGLLGLLGCAHAPRPCLVVPPPGDIELSGKAPECDAVDAICVSAEDYARLVGAHVLLHTWAMDAWARCSQ